jgi:antirestriction protein ArdC
MPLNYSTGKAYQGCNVLLLWMATHGRFTSPHFVTFNQARDMGGTVRKGEKACAHICRVIDLKAAPKEGEDEGRSFKGLKFFAVFNVEQCEGLPARTFGEIKAARNEGERDATIEEFIAATGANYSEEGGDRAFYSPAGDFVRMPKFEAFKSAAHYYSTAFHELGHWTGAKSRCDRDEGMAGRFGTRAYAAEELVAELTSAFLCAEFSLDGQLQHADYIGNWIELLRDDAKAFFTAASKAQQAADFLRRAVIAEPVREAA